MIQKSAINGSRVMNRAIFGAVMLFTFISLIQILYVRTQDVYMSLLWFYTISMTIFIIFNYIYESKYKPIPDIGYRPTVSVIIPAKNEEDSICKTINAILDSNYPPEKLDVIVVDDGSTDNTASEVEAIESNRITFS